jgi:4-amino-4-deoxy-L-arabinose transferase-like glycosyltransferase
MVRIGIVVFSLMLMSLLFGSADRAIDKIQESRVAETAREMVVTNDWLVPRYNGELRLQKPPLTYWTTAVSYKLFGISELAARVPSLVFAMLSACLLFVWVRQALDVNSAANAVLVMATSYLGMRYFRSGEADTTLLFFISLACFAGYRLLQTASKKDVWLLMLALGLGFLTKGPAGIAIPLLTILVYAFTTKQMIKLKVLANPIGIVIFLISAFAWYVWILIRMPDIAQHFLTHQVDETFVSGTHKQPIYWYLAHAIDFFAPWSLLLIPAGIWCYKNRPLPKLLQFALIWLLVVFVLLVFTVNKQTQYAMLFLPSIAILIGHYIQVASAKFLQFNKVIFFLLVLAVIALIFVGLHKQGIDIVLKMPQALFWPSLLIVPLVFKQLFKINAPTTPVLIASVLAVFIYLYTEQFVTKDAEKEDIKMLVQSIADQPNLYQSKPGNGAISFYAERPIPAIGSEQLQKLLITNHQLWLLSKDRPALKGYQVEQEKQVGKWILWKLAS